MHHPPRRARKSRRDGGRPASWRRRTLPGTQARPVDVPAQLLLVALQPHVLRPVGKLRPRERERCVQLRERLLRAPWPPQRIRVRRPEHHEVAGASLEARPAVREASPSAEPPSRTPPASPACRPPQSGAVPVRDQSTARSRASTTWSGTPATCRHGAPASLPAGCAAGLSAAGCDAVLRARASSYAASARAADSAAPAACPRPSARRARRTPNRPGARAPLRGRARCPGCRGCARARPAAAGGSNGPSRARDRECRSAASRRRHGRAQSTGRGRSRHAPCRSHRPLEEIFSARSKSGTEAGHVFVTAYFMSPSRTSACARSAARRYQPGRQNPPAARMPSPRGSTPRAPPRPARSRAAPRRHRSAPAPVRYAASAPPPPATTVSSTPLAGAIGCKRAREVAVRISVFTQQRPEPRAYCGCPARSASARPSSKRPRRLLAAVGSRGERLAERLDRSEALHGHCLRRRHPHEPCAWPQQLAGRGHALQRCDGLARRETCAPPSPTTRTGSRTAPAADPAAVSSVGAPVSFSPINVEKSCSAPVSSCRVTSIGTP